MSPQALVAKQVHKAAPPARTAGHASHAAVRTTPAMVSLALADPQAAQPGTILALQRQYGNQAVQRLLARHAIQAKLTVGPAQDTYEQEANRVAEQVMSPSTSRPSPAVQRQAEEPDEVQPKPLAASVTPLAQRQAQEAPTEHPASQAESEAGDTLEGQLRAQAGAGHPLPANVRAQMERPMGADFSGVRIHADGPAADLNRQLNAQAFTHAQDIYFGAGQYAPGSAEGQRLLAHELTHTLQQTGGPGRGAPTRPSGSPSQIQRMVSRADFERLAGGVGAAVSASNSQYAKILKTLDQYNKDKAPKTLAKLESVVETWIKAQTKLKKPSTADERRRLFMLGLFNEIRKERKLDVKVTHVTPTEHVTAAAEAAREGEAGLKNVREAQQSPIKGADDPKMEYVLRVVAAIDNPDYLLFAKKRLELVIANRVKFWEKRKSNQQIKTEAAQAVVESKPEYAGKSAEEKKRAIDALVDNSYRVGHTLVKFITRLSGKVVNQESFGFWPLVHFTSPSASVPGQVKHPDNTEQDHPHVMYKDYALKHQQYLDGLTCAYTRLKQPPDYKLIDYNCTKFALEVATAAGAAFPPNAFMRVPISAAAPLTLTEAYNPNALHASLAQDPAAVDPKKPADQRRKVLQDQTDQLTSLTAFV